MKLPAEVLMTRDRYVKAFPMWNVPPSEEAEERARVWTLGLIAQINFDNGTVYGSKRASATRPLSKDGMASREGGKLLCWDMLSGAGTGAPSVNDNPDSMDITGQIFEPVPKRGSACSCTQGSRLARAPMPKSTS